MEFTVCICVYHKDNAPHFRQAVESVTALQTVKPSEVVIVADGPVYGELDKLLKEYETTYRVIRLPRNFGHAGARQAAMEAASNELIAVMDADDIAEPNRFELQLKAFDEHPEASVIGGQIKEFIGMSDNVAGERIVPLDDAAIKKYLKSRCPMNLVTVMYRKADVLAVGGFMDWYCEEDYYLWIRLALAGYKFHNISDNLVNVRVGRDMYSRRGGWRYFRSEERLQRYMLSNQIINRGGVFN